VSAHPHQPRRSLTTRFVVVFAAFVAAGSLLLLAWLRHQQQAESENVFRTLARSDASFVQRLNLPRSAKLAGDLGQLLQMQIHFRDANGVLEPAMDDKASATLKALPLDEVREIPGGWQAVVLKLDARHDMLFLRRSPEVTLSLLHPSTRNALLAFWLLSAALGWIIAGQVVRPVARLTRGLQGFFDSKDRSPAEVSRGDEIGELARALTQARDELLLEREKREQSERMALLGRVATGLAHEIKNPLASIQLHAQLVDVGALDAESAQSLQHVQAEAKVIEGLVNQWLYLTRPVPPKMELLEIGAVLQETLAALSAQAAHAGASIECKPPPVQWQTFVQGDRARLQQAFRNLLLNSIQAMPHGGALDIHQRLANGSCELTFRDHGGGFSTAALARGAELFFSEKEGGMGVGLNVVSEIIAAHHGELRLSNHAEGGALVTILLPVQG
jgi:signal transduction histidine kinase